MPLSTSARRPKPFTGFALTSPDESSEKSCPRVGHGLHSGVRRSYVLGDSLARLFGNAEVKYRKFSNHQLLGYEVLEGRFLSSSYVPTREDPSCRPMLATLTTLFQENPVDNTVRMLYDTEVYYGQLG